MLWKHSESVPETGKNDAGNNEDGNNEKCQQNDSDGNDDSRQDIDFQYDDTDEYTAEMAELYSYTEEDEFHVNRDYFYEEFRAIHGITSKWIELNDNNRKAHICRLLGNLDSSQKLIREKAARSLLYILQGVFGECELEEDQVTWTRHNVFLCLECGVLSVMVDLLLFEIKYEEWQTLSTSNNVQKGGGNGNRKPQAAAGGSLTANADLRVVLNMLYIVVETVRSYKCKHGSGGSANDIKDCKPVSSWIRLADNLIDELNDGISNLGSVEDAPNLMTVLFGMIHRFCSGLSPQFPMKKVLLLLWKTALLIMGPVSAMFEMKNKVREKLGLSALTEDTHKIVKFMKASNLPTTPADLIDVSQPLNRSGRAGRLTISGQGPRQGSFAGGRSKLLATSAADDPPNKSFRNSLMLDNVGDHNEYIEDSAEESGEETAMDDSSSQEEDSLFDVDEDTIDDIPAKSCGDQHQSETNSIVQILNADIGIGTPRPSSPVNDSLDISIDGIKVTVDTTIHSSITNPQHDFKTLPWKPKVKTRDLEIFLDSVRNKFIGYPISSQDSVTLAGLPLPIQDAVKVLKEHLYLSVGETQIKTENDIINYPLSIGSKEVIEETPAEMLYRNMLPMIPQYMIALLKILLAAAPTSKSKTESINILAEVVPDEMPTTVVQSLKLNYDVSRHKEIVVKAISGLLLLLLKHFKLNHMYQFEYVSQHLVFANCIPLVLKFFNQNILNYVQAKNSIPSIDFPSCVIGENIELNAECLEMSDQGMYCWRNIFSCINLLRILNMLTKWKHSRTMMMVVFKSAPILKRALKVRQAMLQLYVLKLLKSQTRYFGRQWRKSNMQIMSAIYQKVRHRLTDDWAYGNDVDARPWDFQAEECSLRANVNRFNSRRYGGEVLDQDFVAVDKSAISVLSKSVQLSQEFKKNYEQWLEQEVYSVPINWDQVLAH